MAFGFTDLTPAGKRYFAELKKLAEMEVVVGFQSDGADYEGGASVAEVAAYNELGSSDTPARPFMRQSFEKHEAELKAACEQVNRTLASGGTVQEALGRLGVIAKALVQEEIVEGSFEPNAPSTIKKKGSDKPLIDTGTMRQSVTYVVREAGEGG
jgi:hypothetical protein